MRFAFPLAVVTVALATSVSAQEPRREGRDSTAAERASGLRYPDQVTFSLGAAFNSAYGWMGRTPNREVYIASVRTSWRITGSERLSLRFVGEMYPLVVVTDNPTTFVDPDGPTISSMRDPVCLPEYHYRVCTPSLRDAVGAGFSPLGLAVRAANRHGVALFVESGVGALIFNRRTPYPPSSRFNYIVGAGAGVELPLAGTTIMTVGYRLHHISSGGVGEFNPGIGAHAVHIGLGRRRVSGKGAR